MWQCASMIFLRVRGHGQSLPNVARAWSMRASHSSRVSIGLRRHQRRLVEQPRAVAGSSWTTSSVNFGRRASSGSSDDACSARPERDVHLEPVRAERRDVLEQHDPLGAARGARAPAARGASALPCSRVISRWRWQNAASRTALEVHQREHRRRGPRRPPRARARGARCQAATRSSSVRTSAQLARRPRARRRCTAGRASALTITDG